MEDILGCLTSGVFTAPIWKAYGKPTKVCCTKCSKAIIGGGIVYKDYYICLLCTEGLLHTYESYLYPFLYGLQYKTPKETVEMLPELFQVCGIAIPEELTSQEKQAAAPSQVAQFTQVATNTPFKTQTTAAAATPATVAVQTGYKYELPKFNPSVQPLTQPNAFTGITTPGFNGFSQGAFAWKK